MRRNWMMAKELPNLWDKPLTPPKPVPKPISKKKKSKEIKVGED